MASQKPKSTEPQTRYQAIGGVRRYTGLGESTIYRKVSQGKFPGPVNVHGAARWDMDEVEEFYRKLKEERDRKLKAKLDRKAKKEEEEKIAEQIRKAKAEEESREGGA